MEEELVPLQSLIDNSTSLLMRAGDSTWDVPVAKVIRQGGC